MSKAKKKGGGGKSVAVSKHAEGAWRPGPYPLDSGWLPAGTPQNFWQMGRNVQPHGHRSAMVSACVSAYSQTVAMCPGDHWKAEYDASGKRTGGRYRVTTSALSRILRKPNSYQSMSDFNLNLTRSLYGDGDGNAYALALRNDRFEITELHPMNPRMCRYRVAVDGSIFYDLGGNEIIDYRLGSDAGMTVPQRDVLHVRLHTPRHPLQGEGPISASALDIAAGDAMLQQQIQFFLNQARPSTILTTDQVLTMQQVTDIRAKWQEQARGLNEGGTPILSAGLKPIQLSASAVDSQLAEMMKLSEQHIALAFRVPLAILGIGGQTYSSTEMLMQSWLASGLGFALNHIEEAFGQLFGLYGMPDEYVEFDTSALMRSAFKERVEGYAAGVIGGIISPDEARAAFEYAAVPGGHGAQPRVQQQVVPLSWHEEQAKIAAEAAAAPPLALPAPEPEVEDAERFAADAITQRLYDNARLH